MQRRETANGVAGLRRFAACSAARYPISGDREENLNYNNDNHRNEDKREWYRDFFEIFFNLSLIVPSFEIYRKGKKMFIYILRYLNSKSSR